MLEHLQQIFPKIDKEVIGEAWKYCNGNSDETKTMLILITENTTTLEHQKYLMQLFKDFGTKVEKTKILQTWKNSNQIFIETGVKMQEICCNYNTNNHHNLLNILHHQIRENVYRIFGIIEYYLQCFGFEKCNDNNCYNLNENIQLLTLWKYYKAFANEQIIYKRRYYVPTTVCMLSNRKWKDYEIVFNYQHRTIMLLKSLQVGNPKKSSLEFNVHIQYYNDFSNVDNTHAKWACLVLNHIWYFRAIDWQDRDDLSNCLSDENGELILNDKILTILDELKILYQMIFTNIWDIHFNYGIFVQFYCIVVNIHHKWPYLDFYLQEAINILHKHERRKESEIELYCRLKNVRLENIKEIKSGFFISYVSTSDDIQVAQMFRNDQGCILHFHPSMRKVDKISSCDVSWLSPYKHECETLFSRSFVNPTKDEKLQKEEFAWNAKVENEDVYTQMILLTCAQYDKFCK
ncbi:hypothetical protein RFI_20136 [Reticulomyxa filosa]|uniref:CUE domain-containing protein n=1 Tax=Reticulomyxa filosa TaxID=46433 RepID=X6MUQ5_RETFI|nr:hypothetical protein RFI_20136 [Reticulomyxa filosa]|eukprot:ETO17192.1 hypothetical protein RFI_20136 [Reticulomyxa filosa]